MANKPEILSGEVTAVPLANVVTVIVDDVPVNVVVPIGVAVPEVGDEIDFTVQREPVNGGTRIVQAGYVVPKKQAKPASATPALDELNNEIGTLKSKK